MKHASYQLKQALRNALLERFHTLPVDCIFDAVEDACIIAIKKQPLQVRQDPVKNFHWLLTTAKRICLAELKRREFLVREDDLSFELSQNDTENSFENNDLLQAMLNKLPPLLRETIQLHLEGFSYREIAEKLNTNIETVRKRIERATLKLKEIAKKMKEK